MQRDGMTVAQSGTAGVRQVCEVFTLLLNRTPEDSPLQEGGHSQSCVTLFSCQPVEAVGRRAT
jgi:hypothetical protein